MFNNTVQSSGITHIIAGAGGSIEGIDKFKKVDLPYIASQFNATTSYGILEANRSHLVWNCYSTKGDVLVDSCVVPARNL